MPQIPVSQLFHVLIFQESRKQILQTYHVRFLLYPGKSQQTSTSPCYSLTESILTTFLKFWTIGTLVRSHSEIYMVLNQSTLLISNGLTSIYQIYNEQSFLLLLLCLKQAQIMICCFNKLPLHHLLQQKTSGSHKFVPRKLWPRTHLLLVLFGFLFLHFSLSFLSPCSGSFCYPLIAKRYGWLRIFIQVIGVLSSNVSFVVECHTSSRKDVEIS